MINDIRCLLFGHDWEDWEDAVVIGVTKEKLLRRCLRNCGATEIMYRRVYERPWEL